MKKYSKPIISMDDISEINEPVYMSCSGSNYFKFDDASGWTHQIQETGRWDFAEQVNGKYKGPSRTGKPVTVYAYVTFDRPVNIDPTLGWEWNRSWGAVPGGDPTDSYTIVGKRVFENGVNYDEGIGLGALYVVTEDPSYVGPLSITNVTMSWGNFDGTMCT